MVVSYRNSTSNHNTRALHSAPRRVVSYRNSTSNHNLWTTKSASEIVVSYRNSTSNHNSGDRIGATYTLYLIEILHQTTTYLKDGQFSQCCILSKFYIKPQPRPQVLRAPKGCILSKFYIKPQQRRINILGIIRCILSKFYIKPQLIFGWNIPTPGCILSKFYIKPQLVRLPLLTLMVVSYRNSTSNHNSPVSGLWFLALYLIEILHQTTTLRKSTTTFARLYLIEILHQTTTSTWRKRRPPRLYLIEILHQTTTTLQCQVVLHRCILSKFYIKPQPLCNPSLGPTCCILSKFYIKPQQLNWEKEVPVVVSYRNSTSNHNRRWRLPSRLCVVSYRNSTSNHNLLQEFVNCWRVVSYRNSTSNHNMPIHFCLIGTLYLIEILHQTTTSAKADFATSELYLIEILHQTTTGLLREIPA